jgi:hypothetical protein
MNLRAGPLTSRLVLGLALVVMPSCQANIGGETPGTMPAADGSTPPGVPGTVPIGTEGDGSTYAPLVPVPGAMRRLTTAQFRNSVTDIFGANTTLTKPIEQDELSEEFLSIGAAKVATSPRGVEQYREAALEIADSVLARRSELPVLSNCVPSTLGDACVAELVKSVGRRLFRRALTAEEVARFAAVAEANGAEHVGAGLRYAIAALLQAPSFLYVPEVGEPAAEGVLRFTATELASRLAYFLTDSTPDLELLAAADSYALLNDAGLSQEVRRLLSSPRGRALASRFLAEAWKVARLPIVAKSEQHFPSWGPELADAARAEFDAFLAELTESKRDLREVFTGRTGFWNATLAGIYGGSAGAELAPVTLPPERFGLLTSVAVVAANSPSDRTSPTYRGVFVLERVLCEEAPPPPANVNTELAGSRDESAPLSVRARLEQHRSDPACAGCHGLFDPLGLTFEAFDGIGRHRTTDAGQPVDSSGTLGDVSFSGVGDLARYLTADERTNRCLAKLLSHYATGHAETEGERGAIDSVRSSFESGAHSFEALVVALATNPSFRYLSPAE